MALQGKAGRLRQPEVVGVAAQVTAAQHLGHLLSDADTPRPFPTKLSAASLHVRLLRSRLWAPWAQAKRARGTPGSSALRPGHEPQAGGQGALSLALGDTEQVFMPLGKVQDRRRCPRVNGVAQGGRRRSAVLSS